MVIEGKGIELVGLNSKWIFHRPRKCWLVKALLYIFLSLSPSKIYIVAKTIVQLMPALWFEVSAVCWCVFSSSYVSPSPCRFRLLTMNVTHSDPSYKKITFSQLPCFLFQKFLKPPLALIYSLDTHFVTGMMLGGKSLNTAITWFLISRTHCLVWQRQEDKLNGMVTARAQTLKFHLGSQGRCQGRAGV